MWKIRGMARVKRPVYIYVYLFTLIPRIYFNSIPTRFHIEPNIYFISISAGDLLMII